MCCVIYRKDHITEGLYFEMSHCVENHWPTERLWAYPRHAVLSTTQLNTMISPEGWEGQGVGRNLAVKGISTQATSLQSPRFSNSFFAIPKTSLVLFSHRVPSDTNLVLTGSNLYKPGCTPPTNLQNIKHKHADQPVTKPATLYRIHMLPLLYRCGWAQLIFRNVLYMQMFCAMLQSDLCNNSVGFVVLTKSLFMFTHT
jgi:hypothetical protein